MLAIMVVDHAIMAIHAVLHGTNVHNVAMRAHAVATAAQAAPH